MLHERPDSALELEHVVLGNPLVVQVDADTRVQERKLAQPLRQDVIVELDVREDLRARPESDHRPGLARLHGAFQRPGRIAEPIALFVDVAVAVNGEVQRLG